MPDTTFNSDSVHRRFASFVQRPNGLDIPHFTLCLRTRRNIIDLDEHVDGQNFFHSHRLGHARNFLGPRSGSSGAFTPLGKGVRCNMANQLHVSETAGVAIFVSKLDHCLQEILWRQRLGEFRYSISHLLFSNHEISGRWRASTESPTTFFQSQTTLARGRKRKSCCCSGTRDPARLFCEYMQVLSPSSSTSIRIRSLISIIPFLPRIRRPGSLHESI